MWCIYIMGYHSAIKKEQNWVICRDMDGPRVCHAQWSQKNMLYINTYMWSPEKWYRWSYLQSRKREVENEYTDAEGAKTLHTQWWGPDLIPGQRTGSHMLQLRVLHATVKIRCNQMCFKIASCFKKGFLPISDKFPPKSGVLLKNIEAEILLSV